MVEIVNYKNQRENLSAPIRNFIQRHESESTRLLLEGTDPRVTMMMPYLSGVGMEVLEKFSEIHVFSGSTFAYINYIAFEKNHYLHPLKTYYGGLDKAIRYAHNKSRFQPLYQMIKFLTGKPLYGNLPYKEIFDYAFTREFLDTPFTEVSSNLVPYIGVYGKDHPVALTKENGFETDKITVEELLTMAMKVPFLYGRATKQDPYYDANYCRNFKTGRDQLINSEVKTLAISMWSKKPKGNTEFIHVLGDQEVPKKVFRNDIMSVVLNYPNPRYAQDLYLTYK